jgi:hypothetical protein
MDYRDVNGKKPNYNSYRDPLNPVYLYTKPSGQVTKYGEIEGNKAKITVKDLGSSLN